MSRYLFIPARVQSKRLYNKLNKKILGISSIEYLVRTVIKTKIFSKIIIVTPNINNFDYLKKYEKVFVIKSIGKNSSGIDRIGSIIQKFNIRRIYILFADEILIKKKTIIDFVNKVEIQKDYKCVFNAVDLDIKKKNNNPSFVKVISIGNKIFDFKRSLTFSKDNQKRTNVSISVGFFSLTKKILLTSLKFSKSNRQKKTSIEQFKYIDNNIFMKTIQINHPYPSLNNKNDYRVIKNTLINKNKSKK